MSRNDDSPKSGVRPSAAQPADGPPRLSLRNIAKTFPGVRALGGVDLDVNPGEIHALAGSNGSGKSTLVNVIIGNYSADPGSKIMLDGVTLREGYSTAVARQLGIRVVHQEAPVIPSFTVAEMVALLLGYPTQGGRVQWRAVEKTAAETLTNVGSDLSPRRQCSSLSGAERATLALAVTLSQSDGPVRLLILDEATASLPISDADDFLAHARQIADAGTAVLMVTHRLHEVTAYADRVTVLRDGLVSQRSDARSTSPQEIAHHMLSDDARRVDWNDDALALDSRPDWFGPGPTETGPSAPPALTVRDVCAPAVLDSVSFELFPGEILGVTGIIGSGARELGRVAAGLDSRSSGTVLVGGAPLPARSDVVAAIKLGVGYVPSDRLREGGIATLSVEDNVILPSYSRYWRRKREERAHIQELIEIFDIRPPRPSARFGKLSGGNQQKVLLGKWLLLNPKVLVLDDPTVGVDPNARERIFAVLRALSANGLAVLMISSEPEQLARLCDRVLVIREGQIARVFDNRNESLRGEDIAVACG